MKIKEPKNENYCATVIQIKNITPLVNCDNVVATTIMENQVITSKDTKIGDVGLFFPVETQLSEEFLKNNNLFKHPEKNLDQTKKGYFDDNGRIRCVKFRNHPSEGLFMPLESIEFTFNSITSPMPKIGDKFDELNGISICKKYVPKPKTPGLPGSKKETKEIESKIIDNQFKFHKDTSQLYANLHRIQGDSLISISYKIHGVSFIAANIICKKPLKWFEKVLKKLKINIVDTIYDLVYSSRNKIRNEELGYIPPIHSEDIWRIASEELKDFTSKGMTFYGEAAGFLPGGGALQKDFDYGCEPNQHKLFIYRINYTNPDGKVFEFSMKQVQDFCAKNGLLAVPQLYYGYAKDFVDHNELLMATSDFGGNKLDCTVKKDFDVTDFIHRVKQLYNEKDCYLCKTKVPEEGCVVRIEGLEAEAYKCKSARFLLRETVCLDKGEEDIESDS